jgi:hypothetical protein
VASEGSVLYHPFFMVRRAGAIRRTRGAAFLTGCVTQSLALQRLVDPFNRLALFQLRPFGRVAPTMSAQILERACTAFPLVSVSLRLRARVCFSLPLSFPFPSGTCLSDLIGWAAVLRGATTGKPGLTGESMPPIAGPTISQALAHNARAVTRTRDARLGDPRAIERERECAEEGARVADWKVERNRPSR